MAHEALHRVYRRLARIHAAADHGMISIIELMGIYSRGDYDRRSRDMVRSYISECCVLSGYRLDGEPVYSISEVPSR